MIYLASPYTHPSAAVRELRYKQVTEFMRHLIDTNHVVFSPIACTHHISLQNGKVEQRHWDRWNIGILRHCSALWVVALDGWEESLGIKRELSFAMDAGIPTHVVFPRFRDDGVCYEFWPHP